MSTPNEIILKLIIDEKEATASLQLTDDNIKELYKSFKYGKSEVNGLTTAISQGFNNAREIIQGFKEAYGVVRQAFAAPINATIEYEEAETAFTVLLGDGEKAKKMIKDLQEYGAKTPLELPSLLQNTKLLLNFGIAAEEVLPTLKMLGDVSGGNAERLNALTLALAQIQSTGRLMGQDLLQLINAGFNPLQVISEKTGKSVGQLKKEMEAGKITAEMVSDSFRIVTSEGGKFYGMLEKQAGTLGGKLSNMNDSLTAMKRETGNIIATVLGPMIVVVSDVLGKLNELSPVLTGVIGLVATLTTVFVTLKVTGIGAAVTGIYTSLIPAVKALTASFVSLNISLGTVAALVAAFAAVAAGVYFLTENINENADAIVRHRKTVDEQYPDWDKSGFGARNQADVTNAKKGNIGLSWVNKFNSNDKVDEANANKKVAMTVDEIKDKIKKLSDAQGALIVGSKKWHKNLGEIKKLNDLLSPDNNKTKTEQKQIRDEFELYKTRRELNEISLEDYKKYLQEKFELLKNGGLEEKKLALQMSNELKETIYQIKSGDTKANINAPAAKGLETIKSDAQSSPDKKLQSDVDRMRIEAIDDQYQREYEIITAWETEMLETYKSVEGAKTVIAELALDKRIELKKRELQENDAAVGTMLTGYRSFMDNVLREDMTGAEKKKAILDSMQNYLFQLLAKELEEIILKKAAELLVHSTTEAGMTAATEAGTAARSVSLLEEVGKTLLSAAASMVKAIASVIEWQVATFGPFAIATIPASIAAVYGVFSGAKKMLGFERGGIVVGEKGPEIIAPMQSYAEGQAQLVSESVLAVERRLTSLNLDVNGRGGNSEVLRGLDKLNGNIEKLFKTPPQITEDACAKIYLAGQKATGFKF